MKKLTVLVLSLLVTACNNLKESDLTNITKQVEKRGYSNVEFVDVGIARDICNVNYDRHLLVLANKKNKTDNLVVCVSYMNNKIEVHKVKDISKYKINTFNLDGLTE